MLDTETKRRIDTARDILVGKVPDPKSQVEQITIALIYKFMDDMDAEAEELGGRRKFFAGEFARYGWAKLLQKGLGGHEALSLYSDGIAAMPRNPGIPALFRDIFKNAYLPYRDPETLKAFLKIIDDFRYDHSERLGDAFEYLLSVLGSQGDAGQFRTPRHIIDFLVQVIDPQKNESILDPACGTAGFLISAWKHIQAANVKDGHSTLTPDEKSRLAWNIRGYDISPDMVRLSLANLYLHGFTDPHVNEYDTLTSEERWNEYADVILANPPFMSPKGGIKPHRRFSVQSKRSEVLFVDYMAEHLNHNGRAGIIVPEGIIFQSQGSYKELRRMLLQNSLVAVISLPAGVFQPYSGVKTSILVLDKAASRLTDSVAFFKVENDGFALGAQRRPIDKDDLPTVRTELAEFLRRVRSRESLEGFAPTTGQIVPKTKITENGDCNLSGERYREGVAKSLSYPSYPLSEVCDIVTGSTPSKQEDRYWVDGDIPWFTIEDIRKNGRIIRSVEKFVTSSALKETSLKLLPKNCVLLCCTASVGEYAYAEIELSTNQQFNGLIVNSQYSDKLLPKYLFYVASQFQAELIRLSGKTSFNFVSVGTLKTLEIPLPPLEVQKEIVAEIEGYQKVIDGARQVVDNYRPHITVDPEWPTEELGKVCRIRTGKKDVNSGNPNGAYPFFTCARTHTYSDEWSFDCEAILVAGNGDVGAAQYFSGKFEAYQRTYVLSDWSNVIGRFLYFCVDGPLKDAVSKQKQGNTMPYIKLGMLSEFQVPVPSLDVQQAIVAEIEAEQALVNANKELIARFEKKIQAVLDRVWGAAA